MSANKIQIQSPSRIRPIAKGAYRFLTGLHMDGRQRKNYRTGKVMPQYRDYFWNRYSRPRRATYRICAIIIIACILYGLHSNERITRYCLLACVPFLIGWLVRKSVRHFTQSIKHVNSDGAEERYITLKPRYARRLTRLRFHIRIHAPNDKPIPPEWERPVMAQLAEDGIGDVRQLRMPVNPPRDLDDLLAEHGPRDSREKTHRRNAGRRLAK